MGNVVRTHDRLDEFETSVRPFLEAHEVENSLMLGLVSLFQTRPPDAPMWMAEVLRDDRIVLAGFFSGIQLVLSTGERDALPELSDALEQSGITVPGVVGPKELADDFTARWIALKNYKINATVELRMYENREVIPPTGVEGFMRLATPDDLDLVVTWFHEFHQESMPHHPLDDSTVRRNQLTKIESRWTYLWQVGDEPTSIAGIGRPTRNGFSVGPVYTSPRFRNRGYASGLVAAVTQDVLDMGKSFAVLYTNLENPTSNSIYQKLGYRPLIDSANHWFG